MVIKARYIEEYEVRRFVRRQLGTEPPWWETPLLEDLPPLEIRAEELRELRMSRGLEEVEILLSGALEWVEQNPGPDAAFNAASSYNKFGRLARLRGEWAEAIRLVEEAIKRFESLTGEPDTNSVLAELSTALFNLGEVHMARFRERGNAHDRSAAVERFERSIAIDRQTGEDTRLAEYRLRSL